MGCRVKFPWHFLGSWSKFSAQLCSRRRCDSGDWAIADAFLALPEGSYRDWSTKSQQLLPENKTGTRPREVIWKYLKNGSYQPLCSKGSIKFSLTFLVPNGPSKAPQTKHLRSCACNLGLQHHRRCRCRGRGGRRRRGWTGLQGRQNTRRGCHEERQQLTLIEDDNGIAHMS
jgi:hypothetical protein